MFFMVFVVSQWWFLSGVPVVPVVVPKSTCTCVLSGAEVQNALFGHTLVKTDISGKPEKVLNLHFSDHFTKIREKVLILHFSLFYLTESSR